MPSNIRMEGFTLTVQSVSKSIGFYCKKLGFALEWDASPHFAMLRIGGSKGGTMGLLSWEQAKKDGGTKMTKAHARSMHVELSTDHLDKLYLELQAKGVKFHAPPHDEPWERSMTAFDPDGYSVEFAQGRRGKNAKKSKAEPREMRENGRKGTANRS